MLDLSVSTKEKINAFVKDWLRLLAEGKLVEACGLLDEPNHYGRVWTPELIRQEVEDTFDPQSRFYIFHPEGPVFSNPYDLQPVADREEVIEIDDGSGYLFDYYIPLNGEWSDLSALFSFHKRPSGYAVVLDDLHVM